MSSSDNNFSRRQLVGTLGAGLAAAAISPAGQAQSNTSTAQPVADPTTKYLKPPYTSPFQPWPGLASKMITGGDSGMGRAAAIAYAREGPMLPSTTCQPKNLMLSRLPRSYVRPVARPPSFLAIFATRPFANDWFLKLSRRSGGSTSSSPTPVVSIRSSPSLT